MRRLPTILAAAFLIIQLARVATFAQNSMRAGALGWIFSAGLAAAVFVSAYWTRISAYSRDGSEDRRSVAVRIVAYITLVIFVLADGYFNLEEVRTVVREPELQLSVWIYGLAPTLASAALGTLQGFVDRIPAPPRRSSFAGVRAALAGRLLILLESGAPGASSGEQPAARSAQQEGILLSKPEQAPLLLAPAGSKTSKPRARAAAKASAEPALLCMACGRYFSSQKAWNAHQRTHKNPPARIQLQQGAWLQEEEKDAGARP